MTIPKPLGPKTVAAKAAGIVNRALTREVRHSMGKDQKKAETGRVEVPNPSLTPAPVRRPRGDARRDQAGGEVAASRVVQARAAPGKCPEGRAP